MTTATHSHIIATDNANDVHIHKTNARSFAVAAISRAHLTYGVIVPVCKRAYMAETFDPFGKTLHVFPTASARAEWAETQNAANGVTCVFRTSYDYANAYPEDYGRTVCHGAMPTAQRTLDLIDKVGGYVALKVGGLSLWANLS